MHFFEQQNLIRWTLEILLDHYSFSLVFCYPPPPLSEEDFGSLPYHNQDSPFRQDLFFPPTSPDMKMLQAHQ